VTREQLARTVGAFVGELAQIPPMYSAIKMNGKKLYELARKGIEVERPARNITIYEINLTEIDGANVTLDVKCSKGTYIRTLCHDIGGRLGCGGCMAALVRTQTSVFTIENAVPLDTLEANGAAAYLLPVDALFDYEKLRVSAEDERKIRNGNPIALGGVTDGECYRVYGSDGRFLCISKGLRGRLTQLKSFY
jgi:tRNA pseudouridine55 synthase